jgi:S1-C subfamily serine protease
VWALTVQTITPDIARRFDIGNLKGVLVSAVEDNSPAENAGFRPGGHHPPDQRKPVPNVEEFAKLMKKHKGDKSIRFLVERGEIRLILALSQKVNAPDTGGARNARAPLFPPKNKRFTGDIDDIDGQASL